MLATIKLSETFYLVPEFAPLSQKGAKDIAYIPSGISELDDLITPLDVHVRYTKGLTDILENNPGDAVTNSVLQIFPSFPFIGETEEENG